MRSWAQCELLYQLPEQFNLLSAVARRCRLAYGLAPFMMWIESGLYRCATILPILSAHGETFDGSGHRTIVSVTYGMKAACGGALPKDGRLQVEENVRVLPRASHLAVTSARERHNDAGIACRCWKCGAPPTLELWRASIPQAQAWAVHTCSFVSTSTCGLRASSSNHISSQPHRWDEKAPRLATGARFPEISASMLS
jgi:hypothetical protein